MLKTIWENLLKRAATPAASSNASSAQPRPSASATPSGPRRRPATPATPVYPPADFGIAFDDIDNVIGAQSEMLRRLRLLAGTDDKTFDALYMAVIRNLAEHINQLPASEFGTHNGPGGLFRLALEIGFYALQASEAAIFSGREGAETRRVVEPRWRYACFLAGICIELHRPTTSMIIVSPQGDEWPAFQISLGAWLSAKKADRFFIRWHAGGSAVGSSGQGAASYMVHKIIPEYCLQYLHEGSTKIVPTMLDAIMGTAAPGSLSPIFKILGDVRGKVMKRDEAIRPANYGRATVGTHLEPHLLDAMRRLFKNGVWKVNEKKARLWYGSDGLFLVWKTAAKEIIQLLDQDGVKGIPKDSQTLLDVLLATNVFKLDSDGSPYWSIRPPASENELIALRFDNPLTLFGESYDDPEPVTGLLSGQAGSASGKAPPVENAAADSTGTAPASETEKIDTTTGEIVAAPIEQPAKQQEPASKKTKTSNAPAATSAPASAPASGSTSKALPPVTESEPMALPKEIRALFTALTQDVLGCLLEDHSQGQTKGETGKVEQGFAIAVERLAGYGADPIAVIAELHSAGWLYAPVEKPNKKIHQVKLNNKDTQAIIFKSSAARDAGFIK